VYCSASYTIVIKTKFVYTGAYIIIIQYNFVSFTRTSAVLLVLVPDTALLSGDNESLEIQANNISILIIDSH